MKPNKPEIIYTRYIVKDHGYTTPCWDWTGSLQTGGYGQISINGTYRTVHRLSAILSIGNPPKGKPQCCHKCNNRKCINPKHLYWGTQKQNIGDAILRIGAWRPNGKLTERDCILIKTIANEEKLSHAKIAKRFNVSAYCVWSTINGKKNIKFSK